MNFERLLAGAFAGVGSLYMIYEGLRQGEPYLVTAGALGINTLISFFVGEKNGQRKAENKA